MTFPADLGNTEEQNLPSIFSYILILCPFPILCHSTPHTPAQPFSPPSMQRNFSHPSFLQGGVPGGQMGRHKGLFQARKAPHSQGLLTDTCTQLSLLCPQGLRKRELLKELLPVIGQNLRFQRLFTECQEQLDILRDK